MAVFWGTQERSRPVQDGAFECPRCAKRSRYELLEVQSYYTIFFIPCFRVGEARLQVQCRRCLRTFDEEVLSRVDPDREESSEKAFSEGKPAPGMRILGRWDFFWYPGTIEDLETENIRVAFDDGDEAVLPPEKVLPLDLRVGERVYARKKGGPTYSPGRITRKVGDSLHIAYEDGEKEVSKISRVRVLRGDFSNPWRAGDRVLAGWPLDPFFYAGVVRGIADKIFVDVQFDDGGQAMVTPDMVLPLEIHEGDLLFARKKPAPEYLPCTVKRVRGDKLLVEFEDRTQDQMPLSMIRKLPPELEKDYLKNRH